MDNTGIAIVIAIISSGATTTIIQCFREWLAWRRDRKAKKEDTEERNTDQRLEDIETKTDAQSEALKYIIYDRIRYLGQAYIAEAEIDFDDRRILNGMHKSYHYGLGGNGDLDTLMAEVNKLPLKQK